MAVFLKRRIRALSGPAARVGRILAVAPELDQPRAQIVPIASEAGTGASPVTGSAVPITLLRICELCGFFAPNSAYFALILTVANQFAFRARYLPDGREEWSNDEYRRSTLLGFTFVTTSDPTKTNRFKILRHFGQGGSAAAHTAFSRSSPISSESEGHYGLAVPVAEDIEGKRLAMERISSRLFVSDANEPYFVGAQRWIEECGRQVTLPSNFCGGLLVMRLYRLLAPPSQQTPDWIAAVHEAAAAYDFAFLALGHADDEADMTLFRDEKPTRFVTHPDTRAVDGINLLLSGVTAMQEILNAWPQPVANDEAPPTGRHPHAVEVIEELMRALREASFPILMDRAGTGHTPTDVAGSSGLAPIQIDAESLRRVEAFTRHRAHTYFLRATCLATLLAGFTEIEPELSAVLDELFRLLGSMGAATDDLQDVFVDFAAGIHSVCTVMAHLCVSEDADLRPAFRRDLSEDQLCDQRNRLANLFGGPDEKMDRAALVALLNEIELRRALAEYYEGQGTLIAATMYKAVIRFGFSIELMCEMVAVACRDPEFAFPDAYLTALRTIEDDNVLNFMNVQVGKFTTEYFLERFWPQGEEA